MFFVKQNRIFSACHCTYPTVYIEKFSRKLSFFNTDTFMSCYQTSFFCLRQGFVHPLVQGRNLYIRWNLVRHRNEPKTVLVTWALVDWQQGTFVPSLIKSLTESYLKD